MSTSQRKSFRQHDHHFLPVRRTAPPSWRALEALESRWLRATVAWTFDDAALPSGWTEGGALEGCEEAEDGSPVPFPWHVEDGALTGHSAGTEPAHRQCSWLETPTFQFLAAATPAIRFDVSYTPRFTQDLVRDQIIVQLINIDTGEFSTVVFDFLADTLIWPAGVELTDQPQTVEQDLDDVEAGVNYRVRFLARDYDPRATIGQVRFDDLTLTLVVPGDDLPEVNELPSAVPDAYSVRQGGTLAITAPGVLANDTDANGDILASTLIGAAQHGSVLLDEDGAFVYSHDGSAHVQDQFVYRVHDGRGGMADTTVTISIELSTIPGDFNGDQSVTEDDLSLLCAAIHQAEPPDAFDLSNDGVVDDVDFQFLVEDILQTTVGDANLDGVFNSSDLILIFQAGEYEDQQPGNSTWGEGDWDCDGDFTTADLIAAFQRGNYQP